MNRPRNAINKQLERTEPRVKEKNENQIQLGKFFYSLAGMTYAGVILTNLMDFRYGDAMTIYWGGLATVILAMIAWLLVLLGNIKR